MDNIFRIFFLSFFKLLELFNFTKDVGHTYMVSIQIIFGKRYTYIKNCNFQPFCFLTKVGATEKIQIGSGFTVHGYYFQEKVETHNINNT